jgi:hypothetical protein
MGLLAQELGYVIVPDCLFKELLAVVGCGLSPAIACIHLSAFSRLQ